MSIFSGMDVDDHAHGDLAIGAPISSNVVVLRTLDVAFLNPSTKIEMDPIGAIKLEEMGETGKTQPYQQNLIVDVLPIYTFLYRI